MAIALVVDSVRNSRRHKEIEYKATFSGSYVTGGDTIDLTAATNPKFLPGALPPQVLPEAIEILGDPGGNGAEGVKGTTNANHKVKMFSSVNTELAAGAHNAAVTGDANVRIKAVFPLGKSV